jgi:quercetin dioxygenase-like cupin family protein
MEKKFNEATKLRPQGSRLINAPLVKIDVPTFMQILRDEKTWEESDRNAITVFKATGMRIVLMALHEGAEIGRHATDSMINIQVLTGRILINTDQQSVDLEQGQILTLHKNIIHSAVAIEETFFLLTLTASKEENIFDKSKTGAGEHDAKTKSLYGEIC